MFNLPISPDKAASASAAPVEFTREGGEDGFDCRDCELAGDIARVGLMEPLKRSEGTSATEEAWLRSRGTDGGLDRLGPILLCIEGSAGTGGGGLLEDDGKTAHLDEGDTTNTNGEPHSREDAVSIQSLKSASRRSLDIVESKRITNVSLRRIVTDRDRSAEFFITLGLSVSVLGVLTIYGRHT